MPARSHRRLTAARLAAALLVGAPAARAQQPPPPPTATLPSLTAAPDAAAASPGVAAIGLAETEDPPTHPGALPPGIQVVRFQGPEGIVVEVLGPQPPQPLVGDGDGLATFGLQVGLTYHLRLTNLPNRPGVALYPTLQLIGHLHRPPDVDPARYPIRIQLDDSDLDDVLNSGRMVTHVVYLEDPDQALPLHIPKDQIAVVTLSPAEDPLRVSAALGRPVAVMNLGNREPTPEEINGVPIVPMTGGPCPYADPTGDPCAMTCAIPCPPPPRRVLPRDEYLCDGGDRGARAGMAPNRELWGVDPRDAVIGFRAERSKDRVLPTNVVCIFAPRFGAVRRPYGANQYIRVDVAAGHETVERAELRAVRQGPRRLTKNEAAQLNRTRMRASELDNRQATSVYSELRVLAGWTQGQHVAGFLLTQGPQISRNKDKAVGLMTRQPPITVKTAESAVVTGIVTGANEQVMAWKPQELLSVEEPPEKPGLAVIKQVDQTEAEPGDLITFTITFRNMGNVPIRDVSVVDNLLPRLEYVPNSAQGPAGTVFTAKENAVGSAELRWDLNAPLAPGAQGAVRFQAKVR
jgi:uncharacterized repeat protein (TIGR01451 family)